MRILLISTMFGRDSWGGSEEMWRSIADAAMDAGHDVTVSVRRRPGAMPKQLLDLQARGATVLQRHDWYGRRGRLRGRLRPEETERELERLRPDRVFFNHGELLDILADPGFMSRTARWCSGRGTPYVCAIHAVNETRVLSREQQQDALAFLQPARRLIFVSERNQAASERILDASLPHGLIARNPVVDLGPVPWVDDDTLRLACVGRLDTRTKGQDVLLDGLSRLTDLPWRLSLYGTGEDEESLRTAVARLGLGGRVHFRGFKPLRDIWAEEHALVSSAHMEGMSIAVVEAMLAGRPVLSTDVGGVREWVDDGVEGFIVDRIDPAALAAGLRRLCTEPDLPAMGARGRERALRQVDPDPGSRLLQLLA